MNNEALTERTFTEISKNYEQIRFRRAKEGISGFVMQNIPDEVIKDVSARLFWLRCKLTESHKSGNCWALRFECNSEIAARLAMLFPCPAGYRPIKIGGTDNKPVVLYGKAAAVAKFAKIQTIADS